jgi:hypothetical protein
LIINEFNPVCNKAKNFCQHALFGAGAAGSGVV